MSKCYSARCQQDRKNIRREFNKWTKNTLLQIGLETISKNHFEFDANRFNKIDGYDDIPSDFDPNANCLFCLTREESSNKQIISNDDENSPLDLSLKSTSNFPSSTIFDLKSDVLPMYNSNDYFLLNSMNFDYFSQLNQYSSLPMNSYSSNSLLEENYFNQFIKQMAYLRMIQEIELQRMNLKTNETLNNNHHFHPSTSILTESIQMNDIIQEIMSKTLNDILKQDEINPDECNIKKQSQIKSNQQLNLSKRRSKEINSNFDGKQIRPKRGQYRRYETEQLSKAVAAVLSNEMSVHRAGSYFGVPHSTLEYKVKERNSKLKIDKDPKYQKKHDDTDQSQSKNSNLNSSPIETQSDDDDIQLYMPIET